MKYLSSDVCLPEKAFTEIAVCFHIYKFVNIIVIIDDNKM